MSNQQGPVFIEEPCGCRVDHGIPYRCLQHQLPSERHRREAVEPMTPVTPKPLSEPEILAAIERVRVLALTSSTSYIASEAEHAAVEVVCDLARDALALRQDAEFLHNLQVDFSPEDCDDCPDCGKLVMCSRHSFISALHRQTATTGEIERDYLRRRLEQALAECDRLAVRSDEHLRAHTASFEALAHLSAQLFDGEVDDYLALADKVIERVRQAEAERDRLRGVVEAAHRLIRIWDEDDGIMWPLRDALDALGPVREETP